VTPEKTAIEVTGLTKWYGRKLGVEDVSFDVESGCVTGFLGPNGSGKTTVIRMLLGLISITRGSASVLGVDVASAPASLRAEIGYLPGVLGLPKNRTVRDHLAFLTSMRGVDAMPLALDLCDRFRLSPDARIGSLSKGTRQKVGVVQAFMHEPRVLILDEPTSGLDPLVQREFETLLAEARDNGAAVLLSSHVMHEVEVLASRVAIIDKGRLLVIDDMSALKERTSRTVTFSFPRAVDSSVFDEIDGVRSATASGHDLTVTVVGSAAEVLHAAGELGATSVISHEPSLEDVFYDVTDGTR
jgi:ABC-2 type transport system ATP-binding protein